MKRARRTVYLTGNAADDAGASTGMPEKVRHIYAGGAPAPASLKRRNECCRIVHVGTLYQTRTFKPVLDVLEKLGPIDIPFQIQLIGIVASNVVEEIEGSPLKHLVEIVGEVDRTAALDALQRADLLLLIQHRDEISTYTIPSKTYEYLNSGRRILGFLFHNEELAAMLREQGHFVGAGSMRRGRCGKPARVPRDVGARRAGFGAELIALYHRASCQGVG